jgi:hypothetical protein
MVRDNFRDGGCADVPGYVTCEIRCGQAEIPEFNRNLVARVIAEQDESSPAKPVQDSYVRHFWGDCDASVTRTSTSIATKLLSGPE